MADISVDALDYYASHGPVTDPREHHKLLHDLPLDIEALCQVVQGLLVHYDAIHLHGLQLTPQKREDRELRHVARMLARILELDCRPLAVPRPPERRLVVNCRDFATMLCAMLRDKGIPARARCGFASYFGGPSARPGFWYEHWVCEYWSVDEQRWKLVDAEIDDTERRYYAVMINPFDVPCDQFLVAGEAWSVCRMGRADPDQFGIDALHGLWFIEDDLVRDLAALNKVEMLCWDCWGLADRGPSDEISAGEAELLDRIAALAQARGEGFLQVRSIYEHDPRLRVPSTVNSRTISGLRIVDLGLMHSLL